MYTIIFWLINLLNSSNLIYNEECLFILTPIINKFKLIGNEGGYFSKKNSAKFAIIADFYRTMDWSRWDPCQVDEYKSMLCNRLIKDNYYQLKVYARLFNNNEVSLLRNGEVVLLKYKDDINIKSMLKDFQKDFHNINLDITPGDMYSIVVFEFIPFSIFSVKYIAKLEVDQVSPGFVIFDIADIKLSWFKLIFKYFYSKVFRL